MSAAETIAAAINVLEDFKKSSTSPAGWVMVKDTIHGTENEFQPLIEAGDYAASSERFENPIDAALIVTLHRTIDPALAILRRHFDIAWAIGESYPVSYEDFGALDLARAILGEVAA